MAIEIAMPALSPTMEQGTLARWLVREGDTVKAGDLIAEVETDKATIEFEAPEEGRVAKLVVAEGSERVPVGAVIALFAEDGEEAAAPADHVPEVRADPAPLAAPAASAVSTAAPAPEPAAVPAAAIRVDEGANATPLARRIAAAKGVSLAGIRGSGAHGKIVKADLGLPSPLSAPVEPVRAAQAAANVPAYSPPEGVPVESVPLSGMRRTIARRLSESKQTVPHFYLTAKCRLDPLLALRRDINESLAQRGIKLSVNDMLIKVMAMALIEVPDANVQFGGEELHRFGRVDISMAVAINGGLVTPVIRDVGALSLSAIAVQSQALAAKAREGKLMPEDYKGGTASISNLGMFGIDEMIPVINPPQAMILGIGAGIEQPWKVGGGIDLATIMAATGSFDHRAVDGAAAARFMAAFRDLVETPISILS